MAVDQAFVQDYYDLPADGSRAGHQSFTQRLHQWLAHVDDEPAAASVIRTLAPNFDFPAWYASTAAHARLKGSDAFGWPINRREKLGQVLALFRHFADKPDEILQFALTFYHASPKLDDNLRVVNQDLFDPMARDLIKEIERADAAAAPIVAAPASDRIVRLDDNYAASQELQAQLFTIESALEQSNELAANLEERDQALAELRAGRTLMQATRVRVAAIAETLMPALKWIGEKAAGTLIGTAIVAIIAAVGKLFGFHIPKL